VAPTIRNETPADVTAIDAVTKAAFLLAAHASRTEHFIVQALRAAGALEISLVAEMDGTVVGHVAASPVSISDGSRGWFGVGPVSVLPQFQRRGIGTLLVREALRGLRDGGTAGCVLLGDPAYYGRFGFRVEPGLILPDVPSEYFQALSWQSPLPRGTVSYHEAFYVQG
jgi:putative acetyltransferase